MAKNCPYYRGGRCANPSGDASHDCSWPSPDFHACNVYVLITNPALGVARVMAGFSDQSSSATPRALESSSWPSEWQLPDAAERARRMHKLSLPLASLSIVCVLPVAQFFVALTSIAVSVYALKKSAAIGRSRLVAKIAIACGGVALVMSIVVVTLLSLYGPNMSPK